MRSPHTKTASRFMHRAGKLGLGTAYVAGFGYALRHGCDRVIEMDADFSHRPEDLQSLLSAADTTDVVVGSRNVPAGTTVGWSWIRTFIFRGGSLYARFLLQLPIEDCTGGFNCFRRSALARLDLEHLLSHDHPGRGSPITALRVHARCASTASGA